MSFLKVSAKGLARQIICDIEPAQGERKQDPSDQQKERAAQLWRPGGPNACWNGFENGSFVHAFVPATGESVSAMEHVSVEPIRIALEEGCAASRTSKPLKAHLIRVWRQIHDE